MQALAPILLLAPEADAAVRRFLLVRAPGVALAIVLVAMGICAIGLYLNNPRGRDRTLLWLGVFACLYGLRLEDFVSVVSFLVSARPHPSLEFASSATNYLVPLPAILFLRGLAPAQRRLTNLALVVQSAFALMGIAADLALHRPFALSTVDSVLVLGDMLLLLYVLLTQPRGSGRSFVSITVPLFLVSVVGVNLGELGFVRLPFNPEPLCFFLLMVSLVLYSARSAYVREERLVLLDSELQTARDIQATLLPASLPQSAALHAVARYLPMTEVAGDLYDVFETPAGTGFLIADVTGHGMPAALIASMVKVAASSQIAHAGDPAAVLGGMNRMLCGKLNGQLVTAAYLFFDLRQGVIRYSAAGHPACFVQQRGLPGIREIVENDLPLGVTPGIYTNYTQALLPDSRFILYTDGFLEAADPKGELFGEERLREAITAAAALSPQQCADSILGKVVTWAARGDRGQQDDDLTLLVIDTDPVSLPETLAIQA